MKSETWLPVPGYAIYRIAGGSHWKHLNSDTLQ